MKEFYRPERPFAHTTPPNPENETTRVRRMPITALTLTQDVPKPVGYHSDQHTTCAVCLEDKHTPLRLDEGYVCLTCINKKLEDSTSYNGLTPGEAERLAILAEEAGEIVRSVGKILRHGYDGYHPSKPDHLGNRGELEMEIGDLGGIVAMMFDAGDISEDKVIKQVAAKRPRIMKYAHHQEAL